MTDNERIIALLEDIKYQLQVANWQRAGGRNGKPVHPAQTAERVRDRQARVIANIRAAEAS